MRTWDEMTWAKLADGDDNNDGDDVDDDNSDDDNDNDEDDDDERGLEAKWHGLSWQLEDSAGKVWSRRNNGDDRARCKV